MEIRYLFNGVNHSLDDAYEYRLVNFGREKDNNPEDFSVHLVEYQVTK